MTSNALPAGFRRLAWSNLAAQFSEQIALAAAPLVAVLLLGADAAGTGFLQTVQSLPFLVLSLPAGVMADRASRRRLMVAAEVLRAASLLGILFLVAAGLLTMNLLAILGFFGAVGTVAYSVAAPAVIPGLVSRGQLADANRVLELARSTAFAVGPALGGLVVGWTGAPAAYAAASVLSVAAVVFLAGLPEAEPPGGARRHLLHDLREGAVFIAGHALLRPILLTGMFFNTGWFLLLAVYVPYAVTHLGLGAAGVGMTVGACGAGMVIGALLAPRIGAAVRLGMMAAIGPLCGLIAGLLMLLTVWVPSGIIAFASYFLFGIGPILWIITTATVRQAVTPGAMLGRVSALILTATWGSRPIGAALGAAIAAHWGAEACLAAASLCFLVQFLILAASPVPALARLPSLTGWQNAA